MPELFESTKIRELEVANRFIRSATWEGMAAEDGGCTSRLINLMTQLAEGQVGLIITSYAYIRRDGQNAPGQLGIHKDELIQGLKKMTEAVHEKGGKIILQMVHAGFFANPKITEQTPIAPSAIQGLARSPHREMTFQDVQEIVEAFGLAARRAKEANFDGVQIHAAHGYLLNQFLSPFFNLRTDMYGGKIENRARMLMEVLQIVREVGGPDFPILIKMNCNDFLDGGFSLEESIEVGIMLAENGIDAIELSGGTMLPGKKSPAQRGINTEAKEAYFLQAAKAFRKRVDIPLILVGGIRSYGVAEAVIRDGIADYIAISRPLIREPGLIGRWKAGDLRKAKCISDNKCFNAALGGEGLYCVVERETKQSRYLREKLWRSRMLKRLASDPWALGLPK
jgi:2,4-dienoyl-CoA reductase-like NADH-dependent reductase (Old Yellow Enzyme family)